MIELQNKQAGKITAVENVMIYLVSGVLNGTAPEPKRIEGIDFAALFRLAVRHSVSVICYMAIDAVDGFSFCEDKALVKKWKEDKEKAICKIIRLDAEREIILSYMEKEGIWYLPLKGVVLKDLYPKYGMRQMADNDILYDQNYQIKLKDYMVSRGYEAEAVGKGNHDIYLKEPIYNFEMHTALYGKSHKAGFFDYYENVKQRLVKNADREYGYHFTDEDFYVYILSHSYKHAKLGGTGIRSLMDIYVFLNRKEDTLDWTAIKRELAVLHMVDYEREVRLLSKKLFSQEMLSCTEEEEQAVMYYFASGTYGILEHRVATQYQEIKSDVGARSFQAKWKYYWTRIIPDEEQYKIQAPFAYAHHWFRPCFILYRMLRGIVRNGKNIFIEIKIIHKMK